MFINPLNKNLHTKSFSDILQYLTILNQILFLIMFNTLYQRIKTLEGLQNARLWLLGETNELIMSPGSKYVKGKRKNSPAKAVTPDRVWSPVRGWFLLCSPIPLCIRVSKSLHSQHSGLKP